MSDVAQLVAVGAGLWLLMAVALGACLSRAFDVIDGR